jgi:hypothetical protein
VLHMGPCGGCDYRLFTGMTFLVPRSSVPEVADGVWMWPGKDVVDPVPHLGFLWLLLGLELPAPSKGPSVDGHICYHAHTGNAPSLNT